MSFLDNLENNLKALESRDEGGLDQANRRELDRARALAVAPWAEKLKASPWTKALMQLATRAGYSRRVKVNMVWLQTTLRLEAREEKLEIRPTPEGIEAVFLHAGNPLKSEAVELTGDPAPLVTAWMAIVDHQKQLDDEQASLEIVEDELPEDE